MALYEVTKNFTRPGEAIKRMMDDLGIDDQEIVMHNVRAFAGRTSKYTRADYQSHPISALVDGAFNNCVDLEISRHSDFRALLRAQIDELRRRMP